MGFCFALGCFGFGLVACNCLGGWFAQYLVLRPRREFGLGAYGCDVVSVCGFCGFLLSRGLVCCIAMVGDGLCAVALDLRVVSFDFDVFVTLVVGLRFRVVA